MRIKMASLAACALTAVPALAADTYDLRLYQIDDTMSVFITNSNSTNELLFARQFGPDHGYIDISDSIRKGTNLVRLSLENTDSGWTYGYDLRRNGISIAADMCGTFNTLAGGCNNDSYQQGVVLDREIAFRAGVPEPATWAMMVLGFGLTGAAARDRRRRPIA